MFSRINQSYNCSNVSDEDFDRQQNLGSSRNLYSNNILQCDQFSFKQHKYSCQQTTQRPCSQNFYKSQNSYGLKENLQNLSKSQIIQLLIQEINSTQQKHNYKNDLTDTFGVAFSIRNEQKKCKKQYQELVKDFQEYINNTQQAQEHYIKVIDELKKQSKLLQSQLSSQQNNLAKPMAYMAHSHTVQKSALIIAKLQQTVQNCTQINNELVNKVQKLQRVNNQLMGKNFTLEEENQSLQQEIRMIDKENQKLIKENVAFKSIVDELKDYIMQRREAKQQALECTERQRPCKLMIDDETPLDEKKIFFQKDSDDSIINSSEIRKQEHTLNDSTIVIEKDSNVIPHRYLESKNQQLHENSLSYQSASFQTVQLNETTSRMIQIQNKELKLTNLKLQHYLERKGSKVNLLLDEIQMLREERIIMNSEIVELKCKLKKLESCGESTMGSKCTTDESKVSVGSVVRDVGHSLNVKRQSYKEAYDEHKIVKEISPSSNLFRKFQLDSFKTLTKTNSDQNCSPDENPTKQNMYEQRVRNRVQRLLSKQSSERQNDIMSRQTDKKIQQFYISKTLLASNKKE